jgi:zinc transport system substrate-binding protein
MSKILQVVLITLFLGSASLTGCRPTPVAEQAQATDKIPVTVSIEPQKYFVERIGRDRVKVNVMVQTGVDPHTYEPRPEQMRSLASSKAYFSIGGGLEQAWMPRLLAANSQLNIVDTSKGIQKLPLVAHDHHEGEHHTEEGETLDPHIWLSPQRVKQQAQTIYQSLVKLDPKHQAEYQANLTQFLKDLDTLNQEIRQELTPVKHRTFMVFHPEWGYFAKDYGLTMIAIEVEGNEPSASELAEIIKQAKANNIKVIFTQPEFSPQTSQAIAQEIGAKVIPISGFSPDWFNNMRQVSQTLATELKQN